MTSSTIGGGGSEGPEGKAPGTPRSSTSLIDIMVVESARVVPATGPTSAGQQAMAPRRGGHATPAHGKLAAG